MSFENIWSAIERDELHDSAVGVIRRRILPDACCDLFIGIEKPSNRRVLLLRVSSADMPEVKAIPQGRGFEVQLASLPDDPAGLSSAVLSQTNEAFRDVFAALTLDIASHIATTKDHKTAVEEFLARLKRWQQFLERSGPDGLSETAQLGLFGELWFMRHYLLPVVGAHAITAWTGPSLAAQDFQLPGLAIEAKTTTAREHQKLAITGEKQLDSSVQLRICLFHLSLNVQLDTGISLVEIVAQVRALLASRPLALTYFEDALLTAGYLDQHETRYSHTGYLEGEHHFFDVRDSFPRIVGSDLREGVGDVFYSIAVAECIHYELAEADFLRILVKQKP